MICMLKIQNDSHKLNYCAAMQQYIRINADNLTHDGSISREQKYGAKVL